MEAKVDIWMPLAIGDYLADTSHLDTTQHGAYLLLLMHYWRKGPLPNDPVQLAHIAKLPPDAWSMNQAVLMDFFQVGEDGLLHQKRSDCERAKWMEKRVTAQEKAHNAAKARWKNAKSNACGNAPSIASSNAQAMLGSCPLPSPLPKPLPKPTAKTKAPEGTKNVPSSSGEGSPDDCGQDSKSAEQDGETPETPTGLFEEPAATTGEKPQKDKALREVFAYYVQTMRRNPKMYTLTALRRNKGLARLDDALRMAHGSLEDATELMKAVVDEVALSDWHMGRDPKTCGKTYCEWEDNLFRSTEQLQKWLQKALEAGRRQGLGTRE